MALSGAFWRFLGHGSRGGYGSQRGQSRWRRSLYAGFRFAIARPFAARKAILLYFFWRLSASNGAFRTWLKRRLRFSVAEVDDGEAFVPAFAPPFLRRGSPDPRTTDASSERNKSWIRPGAFRARSTPTFQYPIPTLSPLRGWRSMPPAGCLDRFQPAHAGQMGSRMPGTGIEATIASSAAKACRCVRCHARALDRYL
jgi:hypothetical protein